jgi:metal transporter CNNM
MAVHWYTFVLIVVLILLSAFFSGLNLGLMGLDTKYLELLMIGPFETKEDERAAKFAKKILPIRKRGNLLLCTILLGNVAVNTALSILMADLTSGLIGLVVSTLIIVIIGEIVPQAICNRYALPIGARVTWMLWFCIGLFFIIAYPISVFLNKVLGEEEGNVYSKVQMKKLF